MVILLTKERYGSCRCGFRYGRDLYYRCYRGRNKTRGTNTKQSTYVSDECRLYYGTYVVWDFVGIDQDER